MPMVRMLRSSIAGRKTTIDRLPALAAQLVRRRVTVIVAAGSHAIGPCRKIRDFNSSDCVRDWLRPIEVGLISSLDRPGGNLTGITTLALKNWTKALGTLHELVPAATLLPSQRPDRSCQRRGCFREQTAARKLGLEFEVLHASSEPDFERVFATLVRSRARALLIRPHLLFTAHGACLSH